MVLYVFEDREGYTAVFGDHWHHGTDKISAIGQLILNILEAGETVEIERVV